MRGQCEIDAVQCSIPNSAAQCIESGTLTLHQCDREIHQCGSMYAIAAKESRTSSDNVDVIHDK